MFIQSFMWIIGTIIIFGFLYGTYKLGKWLFFPKTLQEKAYEKMKEKVEKLELLKIELETKKIESTLTEEEYELQLRIDETNENIENIKLKMKEFKGE